MTEAGKLLADEIEQRGIHRFCLLNGWIQAQERIVAALRAEGQPKDTEGQNSRSELRRIAAQKGEPVPTFEGQPASNIDDAEFGMREHREGQNSAGQAPCTPLLSSPGLGESPDSTNRISPSRAASLDETDSGVQPVPALQNSAPAGGPVGDVLVERSAIKVAIELLEFAEDDPDSHMQASALSSHFAKLLAAPPAPASPEGEYQRLRGLIEKRVRNFVRSKGHDENIIHSELSDLLAAFDAGEPAPASPEGWIAERERYIAALRLIWSTQIRAHVHLGLERYSGLEQNCIACMCALALGESIDGAATTDDFKQALDKLRAAPEPER